jgi:sphinganine-1-phosphate aldolase
MAPRGVRGGAASLALTCAVGGALAVAWREPKLGLWAAGAVLRLARDLAACGAALVLWRRVAAREGVAGVLRVAVQTARLVPGMEWILARVLASEVQGALAGLGGGGPKAAGAEEGGAGGSACPALLAIPERGVPRAELVAEVRADVAADGSFCHDGKAFALVYYNEEGRFAGHSEMNAELFEAASAELRDCPAELRATLADVFRAHVHGNGLNPFMFPALRKYENEAVSMAAWMMHGGAETVGALTSGGTESILMAVKAMRELARSERPGVLEPELVVPITIHPAFEKAGHYFGVRMVHCRVDPVSKRADVADLAALLGPNTIGIALSAPQYCHCVVDPVAEVAALARQRGLPLHVDACYGGFILPWIARLGYEVPPWDFAVEGVTSISADVHKYGFAPKGASFVLFRSEQMRKHMYYAYSEWPGGLYVSPSMAGTRPGANIAMAWATMRSIGQEGYMSEARAVMDTTKAMKQAVRSTPGLALVVDAPFSGFAFLSTDPAALHIFALADAMEKRGWKMERQSGPDSLHCSIMPSHANKNVAQQFTDDLRAAAHDARSAPSAEGSAAIYGMVGKIPDKSIVDQFLKGLFSEVYKLKPARQDGDTTPQAPSKQA